MRCSTPRGRRFLASVGLTLVALVALAAVAVAANIVDGATYKGSVGKGPNAQTISFKVSENGKTVSHFKTGVPFGPPCPGGRGFPISKSAPITSHGTFKVTLPLAQRNNAFHGTLQLTGTFLAHHIERGKITSHLMNPKKCSTTVSYSTTAG
jgi:hypothetical protein